MACRLFFFLVIRYAECAYLVFADDIVIYIGVEVAIETAAETAVEIAMDMGIVIAVLLGIGPLEWYLFCGMWHCFFIFLFICHAECFFLVYCDIYWG